MGNLKPEAAIVKLGLTEADLVNGGRGSPEAVVEPIAGGLFRRHPRHLLLDAFENLTRAKKLRYLDTFYFKYNGERWVIKKDNFLYESTLY